MAAERFASMTSANVKSWRAQEHLESVEKELEGFRKSTHCPMFRHCQLDTREQCWTVDGDLPTPSHRFSLYIGDFLYNMRASLDHLVWDLVISCGSDPTRRNAFPLFDSVERWARLQDARLAGITNEDIRAVIKDCQPCFGRNPFRNRHLFLLEELGNVDKHRRFNLTTSATDGGFWMPGLPTPDGTFVHEGGIERGTVLARCSSEHADVDLAPILGVAFSDGVAAGESVYQVLIAIREVTRMTLDRFTAFLPRVRR
jgi:hypothetical protein